MEKGENLVGLLSFLWNSYRLAMKLKALNGDLIKWNEIEFGNVTIKRMKLWNDLKCPEF